MEFHEPQDENNLFFTCSLIEYVARETRNRKKDIIQKIGIDGVRQIFEVADILHCENIKQVIYDYVEKHEIMDGTFDFSKGCEYSIPTPFDIGRVYQRLVLGAARENGQDYISTLFDVINSWIVDKIDNFNSDLYYSNPEYILACYLEGEILDW